MTGRYAVYYTPEPRSRLERFGAAWLGRSLTNEEPEVIEVEGVPDVVREEIVRLPRHYGLHATLKPPFALKRGIGRRALENAVLGLSGTLAPFEAPALALGELGGFLALVLSRPCRAMDALAMRCVTDLDDLRQPLSHTEEDRYRGHGLTARAEDLLQRWGYPWVMEEFRFHVTLTGRLDDGRRTAVAGALARHVAPLCRDRWPVRAISLLHQPARHAPFAELRRFPLTG